MSSRSTGEETLYMGHILALRLVKDYAKNENKVYNRVPRKTLFAILKKLGCGQRFLRAIMAIYKNTVHVLNSEFIRSTVETRWAHELYFVYRIFECVSNYDEADRR